MFPDLQRVDSLIAMGAPPRVAFLAAAREAGRTSPVATSAENPAKPTPTYPADGTPSVTEARDTRRAAPTKKTSER